ncbi:MAG: zinc-ribbon domain-containing protein [Dehalococcoidia bacterium]|nr:zinc-ribbon domain-containing protein [Dehalococcoidia bacterium]
MGYCPDCGAENEADAVFCEACGARLAATLLTRGTSKRGVQSRKLRPYLGGALVLSVAIVFGAAAYALVGRGDGGAGGESAVADRATATVGVEPTVVTTVPRTATMPALAGHSSPEDAIGAFLAERGVEYAGDCDMISLDEDIGSYCSILWEERSDGDIYAIGLAFSEGDTWLLVEESEGRWAVVEAAELIFGEPPPW